VDTDPAVSVKPDVEKKKVGIVYNFSSSLTKKPPDYNPKKFWRSE